MMAPVNDDITIAIVIGMVAIDAGVRWEDVFVVVVGLSDRHPIPSLLLSDNAMDTELGLASLLSTPILTSPLFSVISDDEDG